MTDRQNRTLLSDVKRRNAGLKWTEICYIQAAHAAVRFVVFLADRTNGRAIGTVLRLSVVCLSVCRVWRYVLWLNGAS